LKVVLKLQNVAMKLVSPNTIKLHKQHTVIFVVEYRNDFHLVVVSILE